MGLSNFSWLALGCLVFVGLFMKTQCDGCSEVYVKFLKTPSAISNMNSATFAFQVLVAGNGSSCASCSTTCKLDDIKPSACEPREVSFAGLSDGNHTFEVCTNGAKGVGCTTYNWTVDTIHPTAYVTAATSFTNAPNVSVNVSFSEPCWTGGGFSCDSVNACSLLVYGAGQVIPSTFTTIQPNLKFSAVVSLSTSVQYGRVVLVMDTNFCKDRAGNNFMRTTNSSFFVHFDRRNVFVDLRTHIPERLLQLNSETRRVQATNKYKNLKVYLYFTDPVLNSSAEILESLNTSQGSLVPVIGDSLGNRRYGFQLINISSKAIVTVTLNSSLVLSRQGTPISPIAPVTFLYDSQRPSVRLSTTSNTRTKQRNIPVLIKFMKPVFDFNSSHLSISGGHIQGFHEVSRSIYVVEIQPNSNMILVNVPENMTADVAGNRNLASNMLRVRHYSVPIISLVLSSFATAAFAVTALVAGFLTVSTACLRLAGAFPRLSSPLTSDPARNLFRIACHIQIFALSRWLAVPLPVEYYEFTRGLQWSIPYLDLPWENCHIQSIMGGSSSRINPHSNYDSKIHDKETNLNMAAAVYGLPLTAMEYMSYFESQNIKPEAEYLLDSNSSHSWRDFGRSMFWLALIGGSLIILHILLVLTIKFKKKIEKEKIYGALTFLRFEILLLILALPCICTASATLIQGGSSSGYIAGILLLGIVFFLMLALLLFLSIGISFGKLLQYKEVHQVGQKAHWYQELVRVTLGPGKRGQWQWKNKPDSSYLTILGPLCEDLRGPPKYMLSQIVGGSSNTHASRIIASDDETEDAEAPFIQKLFGILRIYYTLLESIRRVCLGIMAGAYSKSWSSKTPTVTLLCITSFQLFFMILKKPFIKKKVQLVEIISVSSELGIFALCMVLHNKGLSTDHQTKIGIVMISLFLFAFLAQMMNEWYALYRQTKQLDAHKESFFMGLKLALVGFLLLFIPQKLIKNLESSFPSKHVVDGDSGGIPSYLDRIRSSGKSEKPWLKQLRELAKASFSKEESGHPSDPSTSRARWSGLWSGKRSGSSSLTSSMDSKSKPKGLYKDLEAIFGTKGSSTSSQSR